LDTVPYQPLVDLDQPVRDRLVLRTIPGAVDYLAEDVRQLPATVVRRAPDRLVVDYAGPLRPLTAVRYFDICAIDLGTVDPATVDPATRLDHAMVDRRLASSMKDGALAALRPAGGPVRFRVGEIGEGRWELRDHLVNGYGWCNEPRSWDVNVERHGVELGALYLTQRYGELRRTPASTNPLIGAVLVRLAKIQPGQTVLDPFCGAGTLLVLAGEMAAPDRLVGGDVQPRWLALATENRKLRSVPAALVRLDARRLPIVTGSVDRVLANLPFGKRVGSHQVNEELYPQALREIARVLQSGGRAVLLTDDKRLFRQSVQRTPLLRVMKEVVLARGGLHPSAFVLSKRGRQLRCVS
jgi:SAM-dependent methyltransferase